MRINGRLNLLSTMLLCLGAVPLPPPRKEENLADAEQVMHDLSAAGIDIHDLSAAVGPEGFVTYGKAILAVHKHLLATGERVTDVANLLATFNEMLQTVNRDKLNYDSKDVAGGAGKSFEPLPDMFAQRHADMRKRIDAEVAARIDRDRRHEADFTPRNVALEALDRLTGTGVDWESLVFPERQKPLDYLHQLGVFMGVDMAAPRRFKRMTVVTNMDSEPAETAPAVEPKIRDRPEQRAAKKSRARTKAKRGW